MHSLQSRIRPLAAPLILFAIVTGFYWKLLTQQYTWMDQPDMAYQVLPWFQLQATAWHEGKFPLWDPHIFGGQPLLGQVQPGAAYPINWLLFLLPLKHGYIQLRFLDYYFILMHYMAALFSYFLCRGLGRSHTASVIGGLAYSVVGLLGGLGWPQMLNGAVWAPLVLLFVIRSMRHERHLSSAAIGGAFLGIAFLSGHHQIPIFIALMAAGLWLKHIWQDRLSGLKAAALFFVFAGVTGALQILPAMEAGKLSVRWVGSSIDPIGWAQKVPYVVHERYAVLPMRIVGFLLPSVTPSEVFIGLGCLLLIAIGVARYFQQAEVKWLLSIAGGALFFSMAGFSIFHGIAYLIVPMVEKARSPEMSLVVANVALAAMAAYGVDGLRMGSLGAGWIRMLCWAGTLALVLSALAASVRPEASREYERLVILGFAALSLALLVRGWSQMTERSALGVLTVLLIFEWGSYTGANFRLREQPGGYLAMLDQNKDIVQFLKSRPGFSRLDVSTDDVPYNFGDWEGIDLTRGYGAGMTVNFTRVPLDIYASNYYMAKNPQNPDQIEVFRGSSGLRVFANPHAQPFVRTIHSSGKCVADDQVAMEWRGDSHFAAKTNMACPGTVVISETYYPGWIAKVDGRTKQIREMLGALQGVDVESGSHRVDFYYRPMSVYVGGALTFLGLAGSLAIAILPRFRSGPAH